MSDRRSFSRKETPHSSMRLPSFNPTRQLHNETRRLSASEAQGSRSSARETARQETLSTQHSGSSLRSSLGHWQPSSMGSAGMSSTPAWEGSANLPGFRSATSHLTSQQRDRGPLGDILGTSRPGQGLESFFESPPNLPSSSHPSWPTPERSHHLTSPSHQSLRQPLLPTLDTSANLPSFSPPASHLTSQQRDRGSLEDILGTSRPGQDLESFQETSHQTDQRGMSNLDRLVSDYQISSQATGPTPETSYQRDWNARDGDLSDVVPSLRRATAPTPERSTNLPSFRSPASHLTSQQRDRGPLGDILGTSRPGQGLESHDEPLLQTQQKSHHLRETSVWTPDTSVHQETVHLIRSFIKDTSANRASSSHQNLHEPLLPTQQRSDHLPSFSSPASHQTFQQRDPGPLGEIFGTSSRRQGLESLRSFGSGSNQNDIGERMATPGQDSQGNYPPAVSHYGFNQAIAPTPGPHQSDNNGSGRQAAIQSLVTRIVERHGHRDRPRDIDTGDIRTHFLRGRKMTEDELKYARGYLQDIYSGTPNRARDTILAMLRQHYTIGHEGSRHKKK
jgi:hypothetical protein